MKAKFILISGSASYSCSQPKLNLAIRLLRSFTREVLSRGGGMVVLGSDERSTKDEYGSPHIFDWVVLREIKKYAGTTAETPRPYAHVVMSGEAAEKKIDDANLKLLASLEQRNVVELHHIQRERFTGGEYRKVQAKWADAMLGIGGGKGTYSMAKEMTERGKPVLPLDLVLGALNDDGEGAIDLHKEMMSDPKPFFPSTFRDVINRIELLGLNRGINNPESVAQVAVELIERELDSVLGTTWRERTMKRLIRAWQFSKALPVVSAAIKIIESILRSVG